jgi:hypothetical protein
MQNMPLPDPPTLRAPCGGASMNVLRQLDAGELRGAMLQRVSTHTDTCADCRAVLQDFAATRAALRTALPFAALEARLEKRPKRALLPNWLWASIGSIAAIAALVVLLPARHTDGATAPTRAKGGRTLDFVVKSGAQVRHGRDGDPLRAGDALEFQYNADGLPWVLIVGVDADGRVFPYVTSGDRSAPAGKGVTLSPNAIVLDADPRTERVFALFSKDPIGVDEVKPAVKDGLHSADGRIEALTALPGFPDQATLLIRKAAP